jgi:hypothetical protein
MRQDKTWEAVVQALRRNEAIVIPCPDDQDGPDLFVVYKGQMSGAMVRSAHWHGQSTWPIWRTPEDALRAIRVST